MNNRTATAFVLTSLVGCCILLSSACDLFALPCETDADCGEGLACVNGGCMTVTDAGPGDVGVAYDILFVDAGRPDLAQPDTATAPDLFVGVDTAAPDTFVGVDTAAPDTAVAADAGVTDAATGTDASCGTACSDPTPVCHEGLCVQCAEDSDCNAGLCEMGDYVCRDVACVYDEHCSGTANHCGTAYTCVTAHDCESELGFIPYPWDDSMSVSVEGDTSDAYSNYDPAGSCGNAGGPEDIYAFSPPRAVKKVTVSLSALPTPDAWDTYPYAAEAICGSSNLGCVDDYPEDQPEVMVLTDVPAGALTLVADGYAGGDYGPYRLTVTVDECDSATDCEGSQECRNAATDHSRCVR